jgi:hypothetical protein
MNILRFVQFISAPFDEMLFTNRQHVNVINCKQELFGILSRHSSHAEFVS